MNRLTIFLAFQFFLFTLCAQIPEPQLLAKGQVSNNAVFGYTLSPNAGHALWVQSNRGRRDTLFIYEARVKRGKHLKKRVAPFSQAAAQGQWKDIDPIYSPDGNTIYFQSTRPVPDMPQRKGFDIWAVSKNKKGEWGKSYHLGNAVNSDSSESYSSVSSNGNMYFTIAKNGMTDLYVSRLVNGTYLPPAALPPIINDSAQRESNPFIAADESFIIYFSTRPDGLGEVDLFISFNSKGQWQTPINLGAPINSGLAEFCPFYHSRQKRLYFSRQQKTGEGMVENIFFIAFDPKKYKLHTAR